ncbi:hypothetical protein H4219_002047 [Mycoemilia scoparia]|uniref:Uncharacterized protein n=1 Tax=Mycoemilia scoparia TaxID=417184 RepID=A0A9W7ZZG2_9FUNG|nr:hypothetical protein H4219_002047 [Mycoemilia scoparia]
MGRNSPATQNSKRSSTKATSAIEDNAYLQSRPLTNDNGNALETMNHLKRTNYHGRNPWYLTSSFVLMLLLAVIIPPYIVDANKQSDTPISKSQGEQVDYSLGIIGCNTSPKIQISISTPCNCIINSSGSLLSSSNPKNHLPTICIIEKTPKSHSLHTTTIDKSSSALWNMLPAYYSIMNFSDLFDKIAALIPTKHSFPGFIKTSDQSGSIPHLDLDGAETHNNNKENESYPVSDPTQREFYLKVREHILCILIYFAVLVLCYSYVVQSQSSTHRRIQRMWRKAWSYINSFQRSSLNAYSNNTIRTITRGDSFEYGDLGTTINSSTNTLASLNKDKESIVKNGQVSLRRSRSNSVDPLPLFDRSQVLKASSRFSSQESEKTVVADNSQDIDNPPNIPEHAAIEDFQKRPPISRAYSSTGRIESEYTNEIEGHIMVRPPASMSSPTNICKPVNMPYCEHNQNTDCVKITKQKRNRSQSFNGPNRVSEAALPLSTSGATMRYRNSNGAPHIIMSSRRPGPAGNGASGSRRSSISSFLEMTKQQQSSHQNTASNEALQLTHSKLPEYIKNQNIAPLHSVYWIQLVPRIVTAFGLTIAWMQFILLLPTIVMSSMMEQWTSSNSNSDNGSAKQSFSTLFVPRALTPSSTQNESTNAGYQESALDDFPGVLQRLWQYQANLSLFFILAILPFGWFFKASLFLKEGWWKRAREAMIRVLLLDIIVATAGFAISGQLSALSWFNTITTTTTTTTSGLSIGQDRDEKPPMWFTTFTAIVLSAPMRYTLHRWLYTICALPVLLFAAPMGFRALVDWIRISLPLSRSHKARVLKYWAHVNKELPKAERALFLAKEAWKDHVLAHIDKPQASIIDDSQCDPFNTRSSSNSNSSIYATPSTRSLRFISATNTITPFTQSLISSNNTATPRSLLQQGPRRPRHRRSNSTQSALGSPRLTTTATTYNNDTGVIIGLYDDNDNGDDDGEFDSYESIEGLRRPSSVQSLYQMTPRRSKRPPIPLFGQKPVTTTNNDKARGPKRSAEIPNESVDPTSKSRRRESFDANIFNPTTAGINHAGISPALLPYGSSGEPRLRNRQNSMFTRRRTSILSKQQLPDRFISNSNSLHTRKPSQQGPTNSGEDASSAGTNSFTSVLGKFVSPNNPLIKGIFSFELPETIIEEESEIMSNTKLAGAWPSHTFSDENVWKIQDNKTTNSGTGLFGNIAANSSAQLGTSNFFTANNGNNNDVFTTPFPMENDSIPNSQQMPELSRSSSRQSNIVETVSNVARNLSFRTGLWLFGQAAPNGRRESILESLRPQHQLKKEAELKEKRERQRLRRNIDKLKKRVITLKKQRLYLWKTGIIINDSDSDNSQAASRTPGKSSSAMTQYSKKLGRKNDTPNLFVRWSRLFWASPGWRTFAYYVLSALIALSSILLWIHVTAGALSSMFINTPELTRGHNYFLGYLNGNNHPRQQLHQPNPGDNQNIFINLIFGNNDDGAIPQNSYLRSFVWLKVVEYFKHILYLINISQMSSSDGNASGSVGNLTQNPQATRGRDSLYMIYMPFIVAGTQFAAAVLLYISTFSGLSSLSLKLYVITNTLDAIKSTPSKLKKWIKKSFDKFTTAATISENFEKSEDQSSSASDTNNAESDKENADMPTPLPMTPLNPNPTKKNKNGDDGGNDSSTNTSSNLKSPYTKLSIVAAAAVVDSARPIFSKRYPRLLALVVLALTWPAILRTVGIISEKAFMLTMMPLIEPILPSSILEWTGSHHLNQHQQQFVDPGARLAHSGNENGDTPIYKNFGAMDNIYDAINTKNWNRNLLLGNTNKPSTSQTLHTRASSTANTKTNSQPISLQSWKATIISSLTNIHKLPQNFYSLITSKSKTQSLVDQVILDPAADALAMAIHIANTAIPPVPYILFLRTMLQVSRFVWPKSTPYLAIVCWYIHPGSVFKSTSTMSTELLFDTTVMVNNPDPNLPNINDGDLETQMSNLIWTLSISMPINIFRSVYESTSDILSILNTRQATDYNLTEIQAQIHTKLTQLIDTFRQQNPSTSDGQTLSNRLTKIPNIMILTSTYGLLHILDHGYRFIRLYIIGRLIDPYIPQEIKLSILNGLTYISSYFAKTKSICNSLITMITSYTGDTQLLQQLKPVAYNLVSTSKFWLKKLGTKILIPSFHLLLVSWKWTMVNIQDIESLTSSPSTSMIMVTGNNGGIGNIELFRGPLVIYNYNDGDSSGQFRGIFSGLSSTSPNSNEFMMGLLSHNAAMITISTESPFSDNPDGATTKNQGQGPQKEVGGRYSYWLALKNIIKQGAQIPIDCSIPPSPSASTTSSLAHSLYCSSTQKNVPLPTLTSQALLFEPKCLEAMIQNGYPVPEQFYNHVVMMTSASAITGSTSLSLQNGFNSLHAAAITAAAAAHGGGVVSWWLWSPLDWILLIYRTIFVLCMTQAIISPILNWITLRFLVPSSNHSTTQTSGPTASATPLRNKLANRGSRLIGCTLSQLTKKPLGSTS